ncbi:MAG: DUF4381 domain-containing protein [Halioglobus sp.]
MKTPPVPEVFGNYALKEFSEIVYPPDISWMPQTLGWKILAFGLSIFLSYYLSQKLRRYYHNRYRREGIARLKNANLGGNSEDLVGQLNHLLKLVAMTAYPRAEVASLSGQSWSAFLNKQCAEPVFTRQQEEILGTGSYRQTVLDEQSAQDLVHASLTWITSHRDSQDV